MTNRPDMLRRKYVFIFFQYKDPIVDNQSLTINRSHDTAAVVGFIVISKHILL